MIYFVFNRAEGEIFFLLFIYLSQLEEDSASSTPLQTTSAAAPLLDQPLVWKGDYNFIAMDWRMSPPTSSSAPLLLFVICVRGEKRRHKSHRSHHGGWCGARDGGGWMAELLLNSTGFNWRLRVDKMREPKLSSNGCQGLVSVYSTIECGGGVQQGEGHVLLLFSSIPAEDPSIIIIMLPTNTQFLDPPCVLGTRISLSGWRWVNLREWRLVPVAAEPSPSPSPPLGVRTLNYIETISAYEQWLWFGRGSAGEEGGTQAAEEHVLSEC